MSVGADSACALAQTGKVWCWGAGKNGQLGDGSTSDSSSPVKVSGLAGATMITSGTDFSCALIRGGHVECWGYNTDGELGNGRTADSSTPTSVVGITNAVEISAGGAAVCAVLATGAVSCWGDNVKGQVGVSFGSNNNGGLAVAGESYVTGPVPVEGLSNIAAVSGGWTDACALTKGGAISCWGFNGDGELGNGTTSGPYSCNGQQACDWQPVSVVGVSNATAITAGTDATCALRATGHIVCWGAEYTGELGNGKVANASDPTPANVLSITDAVATSEGSGYGCAILKKDAVDCWGDNQVGELADPTLGKQDATPVAVKGAT